MANRKQVPLILGAEYRVKDKVKVVDVQNNYVKVKDTDDEKGDSWAIKKSIFNEMYELAE